MLDQGRRCQVDELVPGDHVCWQFDSDEDYAETLAGSVATGMARGERILSLSGDVSVEWLRAAVAARGLPAEALITSGQLVLADARTALGNTGSFDGDAMAKGYRVAAEQAVADGFTALRAMADLGWAVDGLATPGQLVDYELCADRMVGDLPLVALCGYDTRAAPPEAAEQVCAVHPACAHEAPAPFSVRAVPDGSFAVTGEIDLACRQAWWGVLEAVAARSDGELVLDVGELDFIDLAGLRGVVATANQLGARGGWLTLRSPRSVLQRCMKVLDPPENLRWLE